MASNSEGSNLVHTSNEMKPDIVCPLSLKIAIASEDRLGAIQSYRCAPRPNSGGWETRPQPKTDKWTSDFYKVLHGPRGEMVTLSDGVTQVKGRGEDEDVKAFRFPHQDGVRAKQVAIQQVKAGKLRAPRNWDKVFASEANMTKEELEQTYPDLYKSSSRTTSSRSAADEEKVEALEEGFFDDDDSEGLSLEDQEANEEAALVQDEEEDEVEEPSFSVVDELELEDVAAEEEESIDPGTQTTIRSGTEHHIRLKMPPEGTIATTIHSGAMGFKIHMGGDDLDDVETFYRVRDPKTGETIWLHEGLNEDFSHYRLIVTN